MPLSVTCQSCGQTYRVKEDLAGKKFRCKHCQAIVSITDEMVLAEEAEPDPILPAPLPFASPAWASPATTVGTYSPAVPAAPGLVRTANEFADLEFKTRPRKKSLTPQQASNYFLMWLFGVTGLCMAVYIVALMISFQWGFAVLVGLLLPGVIGLAMTSHIGVLIAAFREDVSCGVRCLVVPVYFLYFVVSRWRYVAKYGWMMLVESMVIVFALIFLFILSPPRETAQERSKRVMDKNMELLDKSLKNSGIVINPPTVAHPTPLPEAVPSSSPAVIPSAHMPQSFDEIQNEARKRHQQIVDDIKASSRERSNRRSGVTTPPDSPVLESPTLESPPRAVSEKSSTLSDSQVGAVTKLATASSDLKPKQKVFVKWGGSWFACEIVDASNSSKPKIHYLGWSDSWDEQVPLDRVRIPNP